MHTFCISTNSGLCSLGIMERFLLFVCLGSLSCCVIQFRPSVRSLTELPHILFEIMSANTNNDNTMEKSCSCKTALIIITPPLCLTERLCSHCRKMWTMLEFSLTVWTNLIGFKSNPELFGMWYWIRNVQFFKVTSVWTLVLHFIRCLLQWGKSEWINPIMTLISSHAV